MNKEHTATASPAHHSHETADAGREGPHLGTAELTVPGMGSDHCAGIVSTSLRRLPGVGDVHTSIASHRVRIDFDPARVDAARLRAAVERAGYEVAAVETPDRQVTGTAEEIRMVVPGMGSDHCAGLVKDSLRRLAGVGEIRTNISSHQVIVQRTADGPSPEALRAAVERAGYEVASVSAEAPSEEADVESVYLTRAWRRFVIAAVPTTLIMVLMMVHMFVAPVPGYLAVIAALAFPVVLLYGGWATHVSAWRSLTNRTANMDVLISMGSLPPYLIGLVGFVYPMTSFIEMAATIMTFHMLGRYLENKAKGRASQAIKKLLTLGAKTARVEREGEEVEVPVKTLAIGDVMIVRPGDKIPTDGEVVEGESHVDESIATGESIPVEKSPGAQVLGATINKEGRLKVRATRVGADTFLSQVIKLVEQAQSSKVPIQEFADRVTARFVPVVIVIAFASLLAWLIFPEPLRPILDWGATFLPWVNPDATPAILAILATIAVLVIACPCALGLATPTALMVGSGLGAERGVLIRSGEAIQTLKDVRMVVLDKTGTITRASPNSRTWWPPTATNRRCFGSQPPWRTPPSIPWPAPWWRARRQGASTWPRSRHSGRSRPAASRARVDGKQILIGNRRLLEESGIGGLDALDDDLARLEARGRTAVLVARDGHAVGIVAVADAVKPDSKRAIDAMHALGLKVAMVTGDNERAARAVAEEVGIDEVLAGVLPEGKVDEIRKLQARFGPRVAMVGDGINDAPALKQANVGIAIGAGADVAIEAADVTLVSGELTKVVEAIRLSKATFGKIVQNLFWAFFYNVVAIPIAAIGLLHPMIGVIAMVTSSLSVIGNSVLLRRARL
jgi:P-type Cu+ transporter